MKKNRISRTIPFGYRLYQEGETVFNGVLESIPEEIESLEVANWYLHHGYTMQSTRDWLVKKTGRTITVPGMLKATKNVARRNPSTNEIDP